MNVLNRYADTVYCLMRLIVGLMFACHGLFHAFGKFGGTPATGGFFLIGGWIEIITGVLVAFGLLTRPSAFLASGTMAVAFFTIHAQTSFLPIVNKGDAAVLYCWIFLFIFFYGAGRLSIDALICKNKPAPAQVPTSP
jgi:putative oxidoreductase